MPGHYPSKQSVGIFSCVLAKPAVVAGLSKKSGKSIHVPSLISFSGYGVCCLMILCAGSFTGILAEIRPFGDLCCQDNDIEGQVKIKSTFEKIVSDGRTGVDRAALDVDLELGIPIGRYELPPCYVPRVTGVLALNHS